MQDEFAAAAPVVCQADRQAALETPLVGPEGLQAPTLLARLIDAEPQKGFAPEVTMSRPCQDSISSSRISGWKRRLTAIDQARLPSGL